MVPTTHQSACKPRGRAHGDSWLRWSIATGTVHGHAPDIWNRQATVIDIGMAITGSGEAMSDSWVMLPGIIVSEDTARKLADVCIDSEHTREWVVRLAIETYVEGYLAADGIE